MPILASPSVLSTLVLVKFKCMFAWVTSGSVWVGNIIDGELLVCRLARCYACPTSALNSCSHSCARNNRRHSGALLF